MLVALVFGCDGRYTVLMVIYLISSVVVCSVAMWLWHRLVTLTCKKCGGKGVIEIDELTKRRTFRCLACGALRDDGVEDLSGGGD